MFPHLGILFTFALRFCKKRTSAQMAKLVDALVSGTSDRKVVQVRVLFWAPKKSSCKRLLFFYFGHSTGTFTLKFPKNNCDLRLCPVSLHFPPLNSRQSAGNFPSSRSFQCGSIQGPIHLFHMVLKYTAHLM